jgi:membrane-bound lytic murein transglycosylase A
LRFLGQVHQTMKTASASAAAISRKITHIAAILMLAGCAALEPSADGQGSCPPCAACPQCPAKPAPAEARYERTEFAALPGWRETALIPALNAFRIGCARVAALARPCESSKGVASEDEARRFFETAFDLYAIVAPDDGREGLVTGYYEPILEGSRARTARFRIPVHGVPDDLVAVDLASLYPELRHMRLRGKIEGRRLVPYDSREQIENAARAPVLAWVEDPVELFFLQIQGSGRVRLESGGELRLGYADQNGHPYRSLGRLLVERGELKLGEASMQGIKAWALANPGKLQEALNHNASYVFFRELAASDGPIGALGAPLTAGYSIAVDPRHVPLGAPVYLAATFPLSAQPLERLVVAQDTGGAIRGAVRADFFWGTGPEAGTQAGRMRQQGRMWLLWPRGEPVPKP